MVITMLLLTAASLDIYKFIIPNWLNLTFLAVYPLFVLATPMEMEWGKALLAALGVFAAGYALFNFNVMGGGDVKLMAVCALWLGYTEALLSFFVIMSLAGGVLGAALIIIRAVYARFINRKPPKVLEKGAPIPYGVAIAFSMLVLVWTGGVIGMPV